MDRKDKHSISTAMFYGPNASFHIYSQITKKQIVLLSENKFIFLLYHFLFTVANKAKRLNIQPYLSFIIGTRPKFCSLSAELPS